jgi:hypothetical protein
MSNSCGWAAALRDLCGVRPRSAGNKSRVQRARLAVRLLAAAQLGGGRVAAPGPSGGPATGPAYVDDGAGAHGGPRAAAAPGPSPGWSPAGPAPDAFALLSCEDTSHASRTLAKASASLRGQDPAACRSILVHTFSCPRQHAPSAAVPLHSCPLRLLPPEPLALLRRAVHVGSAAAGICGAGGGVGGAAELLETRASGQRAHPRQRRGRGARTLRAAHLACAAPAAARRPAGPGPCGGRGRGGLGAAAVLPHGRVGAPPAAGAGGHVERGQRAAAR